MPSTGVTKRAQQCIGGAKPIRVSGEACFCLPSFHHSDFNLLSRKTPSESTVGGLSLASLIPFLISLRESAERTFTNEQVTLHIQ